MLRDLDGSAAEDAPSVDEAATAARPLEHKARFTHWRPSSSSLRFRAFSCLLAADCLAILLGFASGALIRQSMFSDRAWLIFMIDMLPIYIVAASSMNAYAAGNLQDPFRAIRRGGQAFLLAFATLILVFFYLKTTQAFPRLTIALGLVLTAPLLAAFRYIIVRHLAAIIGGNPFSAILIRDGDAAIPPGEFSLVMAAEAYFDPDHHDPVMYDRLATTLAPADRVVVTCPPGRREAWARALRGANIQGEIAIPELANLAPLGLGPSRDMPSVIVATGPLSLLDRFIKRLFDVVVAGLALICLFPLMALTSLLIKLDSAGSVFFKQVRIGRGNQLFSIYKFRSMYTKGHDGAGHRSAARDDERITRVGRIIRSTSVDELPQLINVLKGDMSIVGPRPHALGSRAADKLFWEVDQRYWDRHAAKPGLTGLAQIRGYRGATLVEDDLKNRLQADLEYLENWSIWRDLKIIFLTIRVLLHRNAF